MDTIERLEKLNDIKFSEEQKNILNHKGGMNILAGAGSGKTTVLTSLLVKRIIDNEVDTNKLLCTTFSRSGAKEMQVRINRMLEKCGVRRKVNVKTLHASYLQVLKQTGVVDKVSEGNRLRYIRDACKDLKIYLDDEDLDTLSSLISFQINNLMTDEQLLKSYVYTLDNISINQYSAIRNKFTNRKKEEGESDFDDLQLYMYMLLVKQPNQGVLNYCRSLWEYFYIDECQDLSKIQFEILRALVQDGSKLVMIGDDDQCIYQWRGADPNIILNICGYYDIKKFILSENYRCKSTIVDHAVVGVKHNERREDKPIKAHTEGGKIQIYDCGDSDLYSMSCDAIKHIENLLNNGAEPSEIVVMSRNNLHCSLINAMLLKEGIYCNVAEGMKMTKSSTYKDIRGIIELAQDTDNKDVVGRMLWRLIKYFGVSRANFIVKAMTETGLGFRDTLGYLVSKYGYNRHIVNFNETIKVAEQVRNNIAFGYSRISSDAEKELADIYNLLGEENSIEKRVQGLYMMYSIGSDFMYCTNDRRRVLSGYVKYILALIKAEGLDKTLKFLNMLEQFELCDGNKDEDKITLSTLHGAKGLEWKHVLIFADDNVSFPSFEGITKMYTDGINIGDISASIDENRRLHYVAMTRAKEDLTIFTAKDNMSVFLLESLGATKKDGSVIKNADIIEMACDGSIGENLIEFSGEKVFRPDSPYFYSLRPEMGSEGDKLESGQVETSVNNSSDSVWDSDSWGV